MSSGSPAAPKGATPKTAPKATPVALVLSLLLCGIGVVAGRDALLLFGVTTGQEWVGPALRSALEVRVRTWMLPAGIALGAAGFGLLVISFLPRRKTHRPSGTEGVWIARRPSGTRVSGLGREAAAMDRLATVITGLVLFVVGAVAVAWQQDRLPESVRDARRTVDSWGVDEWSTAVWWRWALIAVAVAALLIGLRWLYAHRPRRQPTRIGMKSSGQDDVAGNLRVDLGSAARNAAEQLRRIPGISSATARVTDTRGGRVVRVSGTVPGEDAPSADVVAAASQLRDVCASALEGVDVDVQIFLNPSRIRTDRSVPART